MYTSAVTVGQASARLRAAIAVTCLRAEGRLVAKADIAQNNTLEANKGAIHTVDGEEASPSSPH